MSYSHKVCSLAWHRIGKKSRKNRGLAPELLPEGIVLTGASGLVEALALFALLRNEGCDV